MRTYYFDIRDGVPLRDTTGLSLVSGGQAIEHSKRLAAIIRDKPQPGSLARHDLQIVVIDESGKEIHTEPVYPS